MGYLLERTALGTRWRRKRSSWARTAMLLGLVVCSVGLAAHTALVVFGVPMRSSVPIPKNAKELRDRCDALKRMPGPPADFHARPRSERFEVGTSATLITNATIFTGARNGTEIVYGDLLLDQGIVKALGYVPTQLLAAAKSEGAAPLRVINAQGGWVTPGLVDLHSHVGLLSAPGTGATFDVNSARGPVIPYVRSLDGFNTHDDEFRLSMAAGVTSVQALPGSGNAIGGQAFMVKLRKPADRSALAMVLEPPYTLNGSAPPHGGPPRWRHMKQACGENLRGDGTRMDSAWAFRAVYEKARQMRDAQDTFCTAVEKGRWDRLTDGIVGAHFPETLETEMLVDVLRGKVKISNHCYEPVDLDNIVRLTNEFQFPIAAFHHASSAYLVPDILKRTWGGPPAIAIFSTNHRYKRESFRGSEFAPRVLADSGIPVVMKTDHPAVHGRELLFQAQQAYHFGLPAHLALASVTSVPARAAGVAHRVGVLQEGADADAVLWDRHPLRLGAVPRQVWIDGKLEIGAGGESGVDVGPRVGENWSTPPSTPDYDEERKATVKLEGLPPLDGRRVRKLVLRNVREIWVRAAGAIIQQFAAPTDNADAASHSKAEAYATVVVDEGRIVCVATNGDACAAALADPAAETLDLRDGVIAPALMTYGSPLGLEEIAGEASTGDGEVPDAFKNGVPAIMRDTGGLVHAADGLLFGTRNALTAHRSGVTLATSSLLQVRLLMGLDTVLGGLSATFRTGAAHALQHGALVKPATALHMSISRVWPYASRFGATRPSISTQVGTLRRLLLGSEPRDTPTGHWFHEAATGGIPLVIDVGSADIMTTLLLLKEEVEHHHQSEMKMVFSRATEAHLIAKDIADANVGVIITDPRPWPETWDDRRILHGPPLTNHTAVTALLAHGVTVGLGVKEAWNARNAYMDAAWVADASGGRISMADAFSLSSTNLEKLLGVHVEDELSDLVAFEGGRGWDLEGKAKAVMSPALQGSDVF